MISFGTDGWRALIARDFTFENIRYVALATARYLSKLEKQDTSCVIGYDSRFLSKEFAQEVALVLAWQGVTVHLADNISSTPQVSYQTKTKSADLGVVITASHNPPLYNGFKVKGSFGGPATTEQVQELEKYVARIVARPPKFNFKDLDFYIKNKKIRLFDAKESYIRNLKKKIDLDFIAKKNYKILYDPMYGAGINTIDKILSGVEEIHSDYNPSFGEIDHPEPIAECLPKLMKMMASRKYDIGIATDGDADRLGVVDGEGNYIDPHRIFLIIMKFLYEQKNKRGSVVKTVSLTSMVDKFCEKHKIKMHETAVGFKHVTKIMNQEKVLIGGEESGGLSTVIHIPERDGLFNAMLILEAMAVRNKSIKELSDELDDEFGVHRFLRRDVRVTLQLKKQIMDALKKQPKKIGRYDIIKTQTTDGFKFFVEGGWLLIRASGTEPLFRFYAEADSINKVNELLDAGINLE